MKKFIILLLSILPFFVSAQTVAIISINDTICGGSFASFIAGVTGISKPHYHWLVNYVPYGTDKSTYATNTLANGDTVMCQITNATDDTLWATSNKIRMTVQHMPVVSPIICPDSIVCIGGTITLSDTTTGGVWRITNSCATDTNGIVTGIKTDRGWGRPDGTDTVTYTVTNTCGADTAFKPIVVNTLPDARFYLSNSSGSSALCVGSAMSVEGVSGTITALSSTTGVVSISGYSVRGITTGTDQIICIAGNHCGSDTSEQSVTVVENPTIGPLLPPGLVLCSGDTVQLNIPASSYGTWYTSEKIATIDYRRVLTAIDSGTATVFFTGQNQCGMIYENATVNVLSPKHIVAADSICLNNPITIKDTTTGGVWSTSDASIATIDQSGTFRPKTLGFVTVLYSTSTCVAKKRIKIITPLPRIKGDTILCAGAHITLRDTLSGGKWISSDTAIATVDSIGHVKTRSLGTGIISYQLNGCVTSVPIPVQRLDLINPLNRNSYNVCSGAEIIVAAGGNTSGLWSTKDSIIYVMNNNNGRIKATHNGIATVVYTLNSGCYDTLSLTVTDCDNHIAVFPNPAKNEVTIQCDNYYYYEFRFMNTAGQVLLTHTVDAMFTKVNTEILPPGMYLINFYGYNDNHYSVKFRKE